MHHLCGKLPSSFFAEKKPALSKTVPEDLQAEVYIDICLYRNKGTDPLEVRLARLQANPEGNYVLRNGGEVIGYTSFYPVESVTLKESTTGVRHGIPIDKILSFEPESPMDILIFIMSVKQGFPPDVANHYGQRLIAGIVHVFKQLGERGVEIENIYTTSCTTSGIKLCRKLGMTEEAIPNEKRIRYRYSLHVPPSGSILIQEYKQGLEEYRQSSVT